MDRAAEGWSQHWDAASCAHCPQTRFPGLPPFLYTHPAPATHTHTDTCTRAHAHTHGRAGSTSHFQVGRGETGKTSSFHPTGSRARRPRDLPADSPGLGRMFPQGLSQRGCAQGSGKGSWLGAAQHPMSMASDTTPLPGNEGKKRGVRPSPGHTGLGEDRTPISGGGV